MILGDVFLNNLADTLLAEKCETNILALFPLLRKQYITGDILLCAFLEAKLCERAENKVAAPPHSLPQIAKTGSILC
jgi:hypothetical protein